MERLSRSPANRYGSVMGMIGQGLGASRLWLVAGVAAAISGAALAAPGKPVPYWASISQDEARMRVGPSLDYPSSWVYRRRDLPVKVVQVLGLWRKIEDPDGTQGWMHVRLLSDTPTAMVTTAEAPMHGAANSGAPTLFRAGRGVVGRLSDCSGDWCAFDVKGRRGYIRVGDIWGATSK